MSRPLNDDEVISEMNKMVSFKYASPSFYLRSGHVGAVQVAFIKQEASEKARELRIKADEEFAIEKV